VPGVAGIGRWVTTGDGGAFAIRVGDRAGSTVVMAFSFVDCIWMVGVILYISVVPEDEIVTGRNPMHAASPPKSANRQILNSLPNPGASTQGRIPHNRKIPS